MKQHVDTKFLELDLYIQQYIYLLAKDKNIQASCGDSMSITDLNEAETIYFQDIDSNFVLFLIGRVILDDTDKNKSYYTVFYNENVSVVKTIDDFKIVMTEIQKYLLEQKHPLANTMLDYFLGL